ncbi:L-serine ammonia-lyase, iron-sulfur-dependent subunit beta [Bacillus massiliigorillae]|uniref:L-serine ammonia-lyase, iron-sulfur-dependent subunit beta n=1 Tax=Bacillus massiliigorillae TaxID=1243664 RepID=UPI00039D58AA|nr:L-serine ammonia-lyase, iron-sulfur-dependent subunit beta [Bacillus massiliigorillae]
MKYKSVFDIIGPIMIGPSSSHTAGAARIGKVARSLFRKQPKWVEIYFYGSFAETYKGHGTDVAIIGGILDFDTHDERIINSIEIAGDLGVDVSFSVEDDDTDHPNTVKVRMGDGDDELELVGISIGGGKIEIIELNGFKLKLSGNHPAILVEHHDKFGAIASVSNVLARYEINIGHMEVSRKEMGKKALMTIEVDQNIDDIILDKLEILPNIICVTKIVD